MKKNKFTGLILSCIMLVMTAFGFSACSLGDTDTIDGVDPNEREIVLEIGILNDTSEKQTFTAFARAFHAAQDKIGVKWRLYDKAYYTPVLSDHSANNLPDVLWTAGDKHTPLTAAGVFESLNSYMEASDFDVSLYKEASFEAAKLRPDAADYYFIPRDYNKIVLAYNKNMFDDAGIAYPQNGWTWDDFLAALRALRANNKNNVFKPLDGYMSWHPVAYPIVKSFGGDYMDTDGKPTVSVNGNTSAMETGLKAIETLFAEDLAGIDALGEAGYFEKGRAAMRFMSRPAVAEIETSVKSGIIENYDFVSVPKITANGTPYVGTGCSGYGIPVNSKNKDTAHKQAAWEFLRFVVSAEGQEAFSKTGNAIPVLKAQCDDPDAVWRSYPSAGKNQDAFLYEGGMEDLYLNYYSYANPRAYDDLNTIFVQMHQEVAKAPAVNGGKYKGTYNTMHEYLEYIQQQIETKLTQLG